MYAASCHDRRRRGEAGFFISCTRPLRPPPEPESAVAVRNHRSRCPDMCILCNTDSLRLLVVPLSTISNAQLVDSIRIAREAAMQLVLDTADAWAELESSVENTPSIDGSGYLRYVVDRAEHDAVLAADEARAWHTAFDDGTILVDPRVQAFLSSAFEGLAIYSSQIRDKRTLLERFLEVPPASTRFAGIGASGEIFLDYHDDRYIVLSDDEAMQIAVDQITGDLWKEDPARLIRYTSLPDEGISLLTAAQQGPRERVNDILAGIIDVPLLAEDIVRQTGYGRFVAADLTDDFVEQRFGDVIVLRMRVPEESEEER
jgi:hypothetical protein